MAKTTYEIIITETNIYVLADCSYSSHNNFDKIDEYTGGKYRLVESYPNKEVDYDDGTPADVFFFEN